MKTEYSKKYFQEAKKYLVSGVNSPVRCFNAVGGDPLVMKSGKHSKLYDYDGNVYTDYCLSWGALILGHAHRNVVLAAKKNAEYGLSFGTTTRQEVEMARIVTKAVPSIDQIRFVNSGTEATMSAIRLARGFTKKNILIKFDGGYHGHFDDLLTTAGSGVAQLQESSSLGVPQSHLKNTISLPYNNSEIFTETVEKYKDDIACVILEPVAGNMGVIPATKEFLECLRKMTKQHNIVLIFDEVMSGFRTSAGCVQSEINIIPDVTCLGKIIGSGFPIGAYGGRKDIMATLAPSGGVYQAGTFSGNPVVMSAGIAGLKLLTKEFYKSLNETCVNFAKDLNQYFKEHDCDVHLSCYKSMMSLRFRKDVVLDYKDAQDAMGGERYEKLFHFLLEKGIYFPPADLESFFVSKMHTKQDIQELGDALKEFFKQQGKGTS